MEPGVQTCEQTLGLKSGSCRDSGWLLVQILRHFGLAARFVSGYLIQLTADVKALDGPSGPERDFTDLHAWAEAYIPGAGWIGLDPTSGLLAGEGHIPLACTASPGSAAPVSGATEPCESQFEFSMSVTRIREDPRVTKPYTARQWQAIETLGHQIDRELVAGDVRLTQGGEPTFVSIDDMDGPEWNYTALSAKKLELAEPLATAAAAAIRARRAAAFRPGQVVSRRTAAALGARHLLAQGRQTGVAQPAPDRRRRFGARHARSQATHRPYRRPARIFGRIRDAGIRRHLARARRGKPIAGQHRSARRRSERRTRAQPARRPVTARSWRARWLRAAAACAPNARRKRKRGAALGQQPLAAAPRASVPDSRRFGARLSAAARQPARNPAG